LPIGVEEVESFSDFLGLLKRQLLLVLELAIALLLGLGCTCWLRRLLEKKFQNL